MEGCVCTRAPGYLPSLVCAHAECGHSGRNEGCVCVCGPHTVCTAECCVVLAIEQLTMFQAVSGSHSVCLSVFVCVCVFEPLKVSRVLSPYLTLVETCLDQTCVCVCVCVHKSAQQALYGNIRHTNTHTLLCLTQLPSH